MPVPPSPLLFAPVLNAPGLWSDLGKIHDLETRDFQWLAHVQLATQALRGQQTPAMLAERIVLNIKGDTASMPLAGSFVLSETPDDKAWILYTPYGGIQKYDDVTALRNAVEARLNNATEQDDLLAFMAPSQRKRLVEKRGITLTFDTIVGDIFEDQRALIQASLDLTATALLVELQHMPPLMSFLDRVMDELLEAHMPAVRQKQTRARFYSPSSDPADASDASNRHWLDNLSLGDAVLMYYRHQGWPKNRLPVFSNPGRPSAAADQKHWSDAVKIASSKLPALLFRQLDQFWAQACADGEPRRDFFGQALEDQARADFLDKRERGIIDATQFDDLHRLIRPASAPARRPVIETVRLWEYAPNFVELAGSLMISDSVNALYTPSSGLQVLKDHQDLKDTLITQFTATGHEDELYDLLSLDERQRFRGFKRPGISGETLSGDIFKVLFEAILTKQRQNIEYALQVFHHANGFVDIHPLFDKALDIRAMIRRQLTQLETQGRWSTRPVFFGHRQPSLVTADKAAAAIKTFSALEASITPTFAAQPINTPMAQRTCLLEMRDSLAHMWSVGLRSEASLRVQAQSLLAEEQAMVDTVFNPDHPARRVRLELNGFQPDAYSITLMRDGRNDLLPLSHCVLLTERGGLDVRHSGRTLLWTPAMGLEVFATIDTARQALNKRLLDESENLTLLENLEPRQFKPHRRYSMGPLRLIEGNVLQERMGSAIEHFLSRAEWIREHLSDSNQQRRALIAMTKTLIDTNVRRASAYAKAIHRQQLLPAWLAMAPANEQRLHIELLEQWRHSVVDETDYLHGIQPLQDYTEQTLKTLLDSRFPGKNLNPSLIDITPRLMLAGPARTLTEFALNHVNANRASDFSVSSSSTQALPPGLDQSAVRQLLLSLFIPTTYAQKVSEALSGDTPEALARKDIFMRQLPWQLMQHAHAMKLQHHLTDAAFDSVLQILDMPDGIARATVADANAIVYPLSLIKTAGAAAVEAVGMYVMATGGERQGPLVLYSAYDEQVLREFDDEAALINALNTPGTLQEVLLRRVPMDQQAIFQGLFRDTLGTASEMTLHVTPITGHLLHHLFNDNRTLLTRMLGSQSVASARFDWEAAKQVLSKGVHLVSGLLPGKLAYGTFLWQAYNDFKDSAEALQDHHWKKALKTFIDGAVQMVSMGRLSLDDAAPPLAPVTSATGNDPVVAPSWAHIKPTALFRTRLQAIETMAVALKDLKKNASTGIYEGTDKKSFAIVAGKVYPAIKFGEQWHLDHDERGAPLRTVGAVFVLDPDLHTIQYGKAMSKLGNRYVTERDRRNVLNIDAQGMEEIRRVYPAKARALVKAVDIARFYAFNSLHNLALLRRKILIPRLSRLFEEIFDVTTIDDALLDKIRDAITPTCKSLVDPNDELMDTDRFIIGTVRDPALNAIAFVVVGDQLQKINFTELFFNQQLGHYYPVLTGSFDIDGHAQATTLIHELSHLQGSVDIASMDAREPFSDLISTTSAVGRQLKHDLLALRRQTLSLATPRVRLFSYWSHSKQAWVRLQKQKNPKFAVNLAVDAILAATGSKTIDEACDAFLDTQSADARVNVILRNADSLAWLISEMGRKLDPVPATAKP